jgi:hypothetical protein
MAEIYSSPDTAIKIYPHWRGGWYYAAKRKGGQEVAMVMVTKWANPQAAADFAKLYDSTFEKRYKLTGSGGAGSAGLVRGNFYNTSEGRVSLDVNGDAVIAIESVPADMVDKVRETVLGK